jgi:chromosome segregation ATPase
MSLKSECEELEKLSLDVLERELSQHEMAIGELEKEIEKLTKSLNTVRRDRNKFWFVIRKKKG